MEEDTQLWGQHGVIGLSVCLNVWMAECLTVHSWLTSTTSTTRNWKSNNFDFFVWLTVFWMRKTTRSSQAPFLREASFWKALCPFGHFTNSFWPPTPPLPMDTLEHFFLPETGLFIGVPQTIWASICTSSPPGPHPTNWQIKKPFKKGVRWLLGDDLWSWAAILSTED